MFVRARVAVLTCAALIAATFADSAVAADQPLTWTVISSPNTQVMGNYLYGLSCASATSCMAVGDSSGRFDQPKTLIESWDGTAWSIVPSPSRAAHNLLTGVSCSSASACTAVGYSYGLHSEPKTLIESWDGTAWSIVPSPNPARGLGQDYITGVSCASASACTAVGNYHKDKGRAVKALIESWNGTAWSIVPSPNPPVRSLRTAELSGVSCTSATACVAVGAYSGEKSAGGTLIESWNGTAWSIVPSPGAGGLSGVSCVSATSCMAAGSYTDTSGALRTLVESWDGATWSIVPSPNVGPATTTNRLGGITCTAATACTAAGYYANTGAPSSTLAESWDGSTWSIVPTPNSGSAGSGLLGVSCTSAMCMAAGSYIYGTGPNRAKTLTELGTSSDGRR